MKIFLIVFLTVLRESTCRPEYSYQPPLGSGLQQGGKFTGGSLSPGYIHTGPSSFGNTGIGNVIGLGASHTGPAGFGGVSSGGVGLQTSSFGITSGVGGSGASLSSGYVQGPAVVQKHIYVHVPPPDPEEQIVQRPTSFGTRQKHYKIIFIKAPSYPSVQQQQIALAAQNQEKTIVYVLVKKPESVEDISVPSLPIVKPSKPEVYFIKYKAQKQSTSSGAPGKLVPAISEGYTGISSGAAAIQGGASFSSSGLGVSSGSASSAIGGIPSLQYGPPGKSGPY